MSTIAFRFNARDHEYIDLETKRVLPHITGMLEKAGLIDSTWFTEESSIRGTAVHQLTADYDLGALDVETCVSRHRGYLLGHVKAMKILQPEILAVEEPEVHPVYRFGGRPDRVVKIYGILSVLEIKSAEPAKSHAIQTALQAILVAAKYDLTPAALGRYALYLKRDGKFSLEQHKDPHDIDRGYGVIRETVACR